MQESGVPVGDVLDTASPSSSLFASSGFRCGEDVGAVFVPPEVIGEISQFIPDVPTFVVVRSLVSKAVRAMLDWNVPNRLTFKTNDLSGVFVAPFVRHVRVSGHVASGTVRIPSSLLGVGEQETIPVDRRTFQPTRQKDAFVSVPFQDYDLVRPFLSSLGSKFPKLQKLHLSRFNVLSTENFVAAIGSLSKAGLRKLTLGGAFSGVNLPKDLLTNPDFSTIRSTLARLTKLSLEKILNPKINSKIVWSACPNLEVLKVEEMPHFCWADEMKTLSKLRKIVIRSTALHPYRDGRIGFSGENCPSGAFGREQYPTLEVLQLENCRNLNISVLNGLSKTLRVLSYHDCENIIGREKVVDSIKKTCGWDPDKHLQSFSFKTIQPWWLDQISF